MRVDGWQRSRKATVSDERIRHFTDLRVWRKGHELFLELLKDIERFPSSVPARTVAEQLVRPTGLLEPTVEIKTTKGQIDDLLEQIKTRVDKGERCLVTTLTKRMAE